MRYDVARDKTRSDSRFLRHVWPRVIEHWPDFAGFRLLSSQDARTLRALMTLDQDSNIDFFAESAQGKKRYAIANRVQGDFDFETLTIRASRHTGAPTELEKMLEAMEKGHVHAGRQIHSYVFTRPDGFEYLARSYGVMVDPLYRFVQNHLDLCPLVPVTGGNTMRYIRVQSLREHGVTVDEIDYFSQPWRLPDWHPMSWASWHFDTRFPTGQSLSFLEWGKIKAFLEAKRAENEITEQVQEAHERIAKEVASEWKQRAIALGHEERYR